MYKMFLNITWKFCSKKNDLDSFKSTLSESESPRIRTFLTEKAAIHVYNGITCQCSITVTLSGVVFCNKMRIDYSDCNIVPQEL